MGAALSDCPFPSWKLDGEQYHSLDGSEKSKLTHIPSFNPDYKPPHFLGEDVEEKHQTIFNETPLSDVPTGNAVILEEESDAIPIEEETVKLLTLTENCRLLLKDGELGIDNDGEDFLPLKFGLKYETVEQFTGNSNKTHSETQTEKLKGIDLIDAITIVKNNNSENNIISDNLTDLVASFPSIENRDGISCLFLRGESCNELGTSNLTLITERYLVIIGDAINILERKQTFVTSV